MSCKNKEISGIKEKINSFGDKKYLSAIYNLDQILAIHHNFDNYSVGFLSKISNIAKAIEDIAIFENYEYECINCNSISEQKKHRITLSIALYNNAGYLDDLNKIITKVKNIFDQNLKTYQDVVIVYPELPKARSFKRDFVDFQGKIIIELPY